MIHEIKWCGELEFPETRFFDATGCFWTNCREQSSTNFLLFYSHNYFLKLSYFEGEIIYSNYMKRYGIDWNKL